jgi:branched-chain amino acid transport system ATP-binding protein
LVREALLEVKGLNAWYGESHILHGMDFEVREGEVVTLLGRNGAGKTTTMKCVMGMVARREGSIRFKGTETIRLPSNQVARLGIALCPEERGIFASLDVEENLLLPPQVAEGGLPLAQVFELFPNLKERLHSQGTKLSGGEQQMLAIARALVTDPKVILLDEPSQGLAPLVVEELTRMIAGLRDEGVSLLLVEQNLKLAEAVADVVYVMVKGRMVYSAPLAEFRAAREEVKAKYLTL